MKLTREMLHEQIYRTLVNEVARLEGINQGPQYSDHVRRFASLRAAQIRQFLLSLQTPIDPENYRCATNTCDKPAVVVEQRKVGSAVGFYGACEDHA